MNFDAVAHFTGRGEVITAFEQLIEGQGTKWSMLVDGLSGTGKSVLVDWLQKFKCQEIVGARITLSRSLDETQILGSLADQIGPTIGEHFSRQLAQESRQALVQYAPTQSMEALTKGSVEHASQTVELNLAMGTDFIKVERRSRRLDMLVDALSVQRERTWVLFVDQTEYLTNPDLEYFFQGLILRLHSRFPRFRVYLTGQSVPQHWFSRHERYSFSLTTFSLAQTKELLEKVGIEREDLHTSVFNATGGHPLLVGMLVEEILASDGEVKADLLAHPTDGFDEQAWTEWIYERIVDRIEDPAVRRLAANLSLFEWFDLSLVQSVFGEEISENAFRELVRRSFVKMLPSGRWQCHEIIRKHLRPHRARVDPSECQDVHKRAFEAFEARLLGEAERFGDRFFPDRLDCSTGALSSAMAFSVPLAFDFARKEVALAAAWGNTDYLFGIVRYLESSQLTEALRNLAENIRRLLEVYSLGKPDPRFLDFVEELADVSLEADERWVSDKLLEGGAWFSVFMGDQQRARDIASRAVATHDTIENRALLVTILAKSSAVEEARQALAEATAVFGNAPLLGMAAATIAHASGDRTAAVAAYADVVAAFPNACKEARLELAKSLLEDDEKDDALKQLQCVLERDPNDPDALMLYTEILISQGRIKEALGHFRELAKDLPRLIEPMAGIFELLSDPLNKAQILADLMLEPESAPIELYLSCISCLAIQGDVESVDQVAVKVAERWPETGENLKALKGLARSVVGQHSEAIEILEPLIKLQVPIMDAYIGLARSLGETGKRKQERAVLQELTKRVPALQDFADNLVATSLSMDQGPGAALRYLQNEARKRQLGPLAQLALAVSNIALGNLTVARDILEHVIYTQGRETLPIGMLISSRYQLASLLVQAGEYNEARNIARELLEVFPEITNASRAAAAIFALLNDEEELRKMFRLKQSNPLLQFQVGGALASVILSREATLEGLLTECERHPDRIEIIWAIDLLLTSTSQLEKWEEVIPHVEEIAPGLFEAYLRMQGQFSQMASPELEATLRKARELAPDFVPVRFSFIKTLLAMGKIEEAFQELDELVARHPELKTAGIVWKVGALVENGRFQEAETLLAPYTDMDDPQMLIASAIWQLLDAKNDDEQMLRFAKRMEPLYPNFMELWRIQAVNRLFDRLLEEGKAQDVLGLVQAGLEGAGEVNPEASPLADFLLAKAKALRQLGRMSEALDVLKALEQRQNLGAKVVREAYALKGEMLGTSGEVEAAEAAFLKGIEIDPWNPEPYLGLVQLFRKQERWGDAFEALKNAVAVKPALVHTYEEDLRTLRNMSLHSR